MLRGAIGFLNVEILYNSGHHGGSKKASDPAVIMSNERLQRYAFRLLDFLVASIPGTSARGNHTLMASECEPNQTDGNGLPRP